MIFPSAFTVIETVSILMRVGTASYVIKVIETYLSVKPMYIFRAKRIYLLSIVYIKCLKNYEPRESFPYFVQKELSLLILICTYAKYGIIKYTVNGLKQKKI